MKRATLLKAIQPCKPPEKNDIDSVQAVCQVAAVDGKDYLNIDMYYRGRCRARYFADIKENRHTANVDGKWYNCMMNNVARLCKNLTTVKSDYYYYSNEWHFATTKDEKIALGYLGTSRFDSFEYCVNQNKYERIYQRKCRRIEDMMGKIPCVPEDMEVWVRKEIFPENYLFIRKRSKTRTEFSCTACGVQSWKKKGWRHGESSTCPKCGKPVRVWSKKQERTAKAPVILLQGCGEEWVERQFRAVCTWKAGEIKNIELQEDVRAIIKRGENWGKVYYGIQKNADEFEQGWWDKNQLNKRFVASYLYPGNLREMLEYGDLQKSGLDILARKKCRINVNTFITTFHNRPYIEYLAKAGFSALVADILDTYGWWGENPENICTYATSVQGALDLDGNRVNRLKQLNGGLSVLEWLQYEEEREFLGKRIKISQEALEYLNAKKVQKKDCEEILEELGSVNRMVNYMKKQRISPNTLTRTWRDYLRMAREEGMDTTDDIVRMPKDIKARHDQLVELRNARRDKERLEKEKKKNQELDKKILEHMPEVKRYFWENGTYMIIPAGTCQELINEGITLHHCVGSSDTYMQKMARGESWILFLRKKENLEKSYYTIEIELKTDKILQWYSEFDRKPDKEIISNILSKFKKQIKRKPTMESVQVAATA